MIEIHGVSYRFADGRIGLQDVDLNIPKGELLVIAGANGSGKTTLLRHLNGLLLPQTGDVRVNGKAVAGNLHHARRQVGMVFQESDSQIVGESVYADVAFGPENLAWSDQDVKSAVARALDQVGLAHLAYQSPHLLSGGERKRLAIAGVLAMQPEIVVFDEPFANLDYPGVRKVLSQIVALHRQGATILVAAHDVEKIIYHAQRLIIMQQGRIVADGAPDEMIARLEEYDVRMPCLARKGTGVESWLS